LARFPFAVAAFGSYLISDKLNDGQMKIIIGSVLMGIAMQIA